MSQSELGTTIGKNGKIIFYSAEDFLSLCNDSRRCFICGIAQLPTIKFNKEHIFPKWLLKRYKLIDKQYKLPNDDLKNYKSSKIRMCDKCNRELGVRYEEPLSGFLSSNYAEFAKKLVFQPKYQRELFLWLNLVFFKTCISKREIRWNSDLRKDDYTILDTFDLENLYHIHTIVRSHHTEAILSNEVFGSMFIGAAQDAESFDFLNNPRASTIMLKLGDKYIITVLDDAKAISLALYDVFIRKITYEALNYIQIRELFSHITYSSLALKNKPLYKSSYNDGKCIIFGEIPEYYLFESHEKMTINFQDIFLYYLRNVISEEELKEIKEKNGSFIFKKDASIRI